jgi:transcriptional regulator GlxA family with amidase domain
MTPRFQFSVLALATVLTGAVPASDRVTEHRAAHRPELDPGTALSIPTHELRFGRQRPVVAVVGENSATEVTDYVVPYGILAEADVAEVIALATGEGVMEMKPSLRILPQATIREFDARYPHGADYVVVPNVYAGAENPVLLEWVRQQSSRGATIVGICDGVPVLANAGLLEGRRATAHWKTIDRLERKHPGTQWVRNRRYIADGNVITTSGVSASIPVSVALVEAIGGSARAKEVAETLGVRNWSPVHDSEQFSLRGSLVTALLNKLLIWRHEELGLQVSSGVDEVSLAITADAYSRTRRSWAYSVAPSLEPVRTRRGLILLPDLVRQPRSMLYHWELPAEEALDRALEGIASRYGERTAAFVAVQIEYPWK